MSKIRFYCSGLFISSNLLRATTGAIGFMCHLMVLALMHSLGYLVGCKPNRAIVVDGIVDSLPSDYGYVSLGTYYSMWKRNYPQLKVSHHAEDFTIKT